jgi:hypothetical protein
MLMIDVGLRNTGKVMVEAGAMGCRIWLRHLPMEAEIGQPVDLDGGNVVVDGLDLLAGYDKSCPYEIEPGAEYHEFCAVPVKPGTLFSVKATFYLGVRKTTQYLSADSRSWNNAASNPHRAARSRKDEAAHAVFRFRAFPAKGSPGTPSVSPAGSTLRQ